MQVSDTAIDLLRRDLDPVFHSESYSRPRIKLQNDIIRRRIITVSRSALQFNQDKKKKLVFLAGPVGAGKSTFVHTLLNSSAKQSCLLVDMDSIRDELPDSNGFKVHTPLKYGKSTQKESGCIAELLVRLGLTLGITTIVDASMFDVDWHTEYIKAIKSQFDVQIFVIHVTAEEEVIRRRIAQRNSEGNRFIPDEILEASIKSLHLMATSIIKLSFVVDLLVSIDNSTDHPTILHPWHFTWQQLLSAINITNNDETYRFSNSAYLFHSKGRSHQNFSLSSATTIPVTITESSAISCDVYDHNSSNSYEESSITEDTVSYRTTTTHTAAELVTQSEPCAACDVTAVRDFLHNIDKDLASKTDTRRISRGGSKKDRSYRWPMATAAAPLYDSQQKKDSTETIDYFSSPLERAKEYCKKEQRCLTCSLDDWPVSTCSSLKRKGTERL